MFVSIVKRLAIMRMKRDTAEYDIHQSFAKWCLGWGLVLGIILIVLSAITVAPTARITVLRVGLTLAYFSGALLFFSARSFVIAYQCKHNIEQTFATPCPEYISWPLFALTIVTWTWSV